MGRRTAPAGMTLIELLIVIAIIAVLVQLALPAIESSREAARRTACQNNLRQIGLAMTHHESSLKYLPTAGWGWAWIGDPDRGTGKSQPGSWAYQLLPYMEQQNVFDIGRGASGDAKYEALTTLAATPVPTFYCPSRRLPRATSNLGPPVDVADSANGLFWYNAKKAEKLARTDYAANVGDRWIYWHEGPPPKKADEGNGFFAFTNITNDETMTLNDVNGVVVQRQPFTMAQITDGISKTYFAGEKIVPIEAYKEGWNLNDDQSCWNGDDLDTMATTEFIPWRDFSVEHPPEGRVGIPFGSAHVDGLNMLMCDGSVHTVSYDVDPTVHQRSGNRRDQEVTSAPQD